MEDRRARNGAVLMGEIAIGLPQQAPERVLAIGAHPDDIDFCAAGTVAQWVRRGVAVTYCVITDGDAGGFDPAVPRSEIAGIRQREQRDAAAEVGVDEVVFLGYPDGRLVLSTELRRDLARVIRQVRPELVICHSPERIWEGRVNYNHPDHFIAGEATLSAVYPDARNRFAYPELTDEGLEPHMVDSVWVIEPLAPTRLVDISDTFELKLAALARHASQFSRGSELMRPHLEAEAGRLARLAPDGELALAEGFRVVVTAE